MLAKLHRQTITYRAKLRAHLPAYGDLRTRTRGLDRDCVCWSPDAVGMAIEAFFERNCRCIRAGEDNVCLRDFEMYPIASVLGAHTWMEVEPDHRVTRRSEVILDEKYIVP